MIKFYKCQIVERDKSVMGCAGINIMNATLNIHKIITGTPHLVRLC